MHFPKENPIIIIDRINHQMRGTCYSHNNNNHQQHQPSIKKTFSSIVCLRISLTKLKLSITGNIALTVNICDPSCTSACNIRPFLRPITAYILPLRKNKFK
ncbi:hypothetical protein DERP_003308 [Dermatophagoides pteronyssinus]|uniref:Uncharacterized protein n=1 Tax=Dermatophagoides pteronyssinus TaxID=6956 RepID=A0ABQ8JJ67_DERPT|nr:hypothetical protein DERP_003308 [Dermatophagoides pteronyssinus]